ncbi:transcriptional repressor NrdR [Christensenellaceae bacterium NSJ-44]|jgi:transcriptional repressor NrdR|uniref:Transcriptional repressor NrdR n=1 Tax=Luoshenia tenuis TaxID=2763654 RepID=A0A926D214_9FIRM|nr:MULTISPECIES: transcriptional regulator NrdR [Clostridia]MBC8529917.1 transcriptional repressor NrdR [Luoshenia tenuis]SCJ66580.1 Transcriptional repressor NrdR [uncultured Clostridium sp.]
MKCRYCGCTELRVIDSRPTEDGAIRRRRECTNCLRRFTTYEKIETLPIYVVKKDGRRQAFDIAKLRAGLIKACEKRPIPLKDVEALAQSIEMQLNNEMVQEVTSLQLGEMVMKRLKELDEVAYVRFASVYRQFKDINTFRDELNRLLGEDRP